MILGFDIRIVDWPGIAARWPESRRSLYLLRPGVPWVASVDSAVFPSAFDFGNRFNDPDSEFVIARVSPTDMHQQALGLWRDVDAMQEALLRVSLPEGAVCMPVAIVGAGAVVTRPHGPWAAIADEATNPPVVSREWNLLGYDVADASLLSGLSNCGYGRDEWATLGPVWSDRLNGVGLFSDGEEAHQFSVLTNQRVPEHAPFLVFGLYDLGPMNSTRGARR